MSDRFLDRIYAARDGETTRRLYDAWAASYETELGENGYATPDRCARALRACIDDPSRPILDFGCGTGLSGQALNRAGFTTIDGLDISADMLAVARGKGLYRDLRQIEPDAALDHAPGSYAAIAAIGVIGAGAAPVAVVDRILRGLAPGGLFVLSYNDHALEDPACQGKLNEWLDCGAARLRFREYGPHLPGIGLNANVYVLEKT